MTYPPKHECRTAYVDMKSQFFCQKREPKPRVVRCPCCNAELVIEYEDINDNADDEQENGHD